MFTNLSTRGVLLVIAAGLAGIVLIYVLIMLALIWSARHEHPPAGIRHMIILGAQVSKFKPTFPSPQLKERLDTALAYLLKNKQVFVIVTGGQGANEAEPEADVMARYLIERGVDPKRIVIENQSTTTIENFTFSRKLIDIDTAIIVTNGYHMYRAKRTARLHGFKHVYALAAPAGSGKTIKAYLREILALGYHLIFTR